jgi:hypothetical protein
VLFIANFKQIIFHFCVIIFTLPVVCECLYAIW